jgi:hypothetical protein
MARGSEGLIVYCTDCGTETTFTNNEIGRAQLTLWAMFHEKRAHTEKPKE